MENEQQFYTLITNVGQAKLANATALGTKVNFAKLQVGDGKDYNPNEAQENLKNKVWEGNINSITTDSKNKNWIVIQTVIPSNAGGFNITEVGVFDDEDNMLIVSKYPQTYKPKLSNGSGKDLTIKLVIQVSNTESVTLKIDPSITIATKEDIKVVEDKITEINTNTTKEIKEFKGEIDTKYVDIAKGIKEENTKNKKELEKQVQDFIDTKNKINGIVGLNEEGKILKDVLPKDLGNVKIAKGVYIGNEEKRNIQTGFKPACIFIKEHYTAGSAWRGDKQILINVGNATWDIAGYDYRYFKIVNNGFELGADSNILRTMNKNNTHYSYIAIG